MNTYRKKPRLLIILLYWYPYSGPHTPIYAGLFRAWKSKGYEITIISSFPHFRFGTAETWPEYRGKLFEITSWEDIRLIRTFVLAPVFKNKKIALICRALNFISFNFSSLIAAVFLGGKADIILTLSSPPLTNGIVGWIVSRTKKCSCIYNMVDVYPDMAEKMNLTKNPLIIKSLKWIEKLVYTLSDSIVVLSNAMRKNLLIKKVPENKIYVIPDFIETEKIYPREKDNTFSRQFELVKKFVVMYAGNIGIPHGVEFVIEAASLLQDEKETIFCIVGRGENKNSIVNLAESKNLNNVIFPPRQPEEMVPLIWASADISLVTYRKGLAEYSVPSKLLFIMASGRPVILTADENSEASYIVKEANCGYVIDPEDPQLLAESIIKLKDDSLTSKKMGENGFEYIKRYFKKDVVEKQFEDVFNKMYTDKYKCKVI